MSLTEEQLALVYLSELDIEKIGKMPKDKRTAALEDAMWNLKSELLNETSNDREVPPELIIQIRCTKLLMTMKKDQEWHDAVTFLQEMQE